MRIVTGVTRQVQVSAGGGVHDLMYQMATAKAGLNKAILDAGWAQFASILTAKAQSAGRRVVFVNPAGTSITCHRCGRQCTRPRQDSVICPTHGNIDADTNYQRGAQHRRQGRAGLWSSPRGLKSRCLQASEQSRSERSEQARIAAMLIGPFRSNARYRFHCMISS
jgi:Putative transposase DNA-binding domain